jgi:hypothetical protein
MKQIEFEFGLNLFGAETSLEKIGEFPKILNYLDLQE